MVALEAAVDKAVAKAKAGASGVRGLAICGTYNTCTSTGMLAYYADRIAKAFAPSPSRSRSRALPAPRPSVSFSPQRRGREVLPCR